MAIPNFYVETGIQHVALLLQETHANLPTGKLLRMSIEATKVEIIRSVWAVSNGQLDQTHVEVFVRS